LNSWIFQCNPDRFDIDGYLATEPSRFLWLVARYANDMEPGDRVFLYRTGTTAGVIAEAKIIGAPAQQIDAPDAAPFWREDPDGVMKVAVRVPLSLVRVGGNREVLRRDWLREDPVLRELPNLKMANGTNYSIHPTHAARLMTLWDRTGHDWTRNESVAGLWAYAKTYGQQVSRLPGSPVAQVALSVGRAVSGVYNKVMNFRAIDPRDQRAGMSGGSETDRQVWSKFYNAEAGEILLVELEREFDRLWRSGGETAGSPTDADQDAGLYSRAKELAAAGLDTLMVRYRNERQARPSRPDTKSQSVRTYERSALVVAIARLRADNRCEVPDCNHSTFLDEDGIPYTEVHHIEPLSEGGADILENVACLCPAHHREAHLGRRATELAAALRAIRNQERHS
jgi:5-methylcytosine-specific restriction endonuclease McrA